MAAPGRLEDTPGRLEDTPDEIEYDDIGNEKVYVVHELRIREKYIGVYNTQYRYHNSFYVNPTMKKAIDCAIKFMKKEYDGYDWDHIREILSTPEIEHADTWKGSVSRNVLIGPNSSRIRYSIITTYHENRYSYDVECFLNEELKKNCGIRLDDHEYGVEPRHEDDDDRDRE